MLQLRRSLRLYINRWVWLTLLLMLVALIGIGWWAETSHGQAQTPHGASLSTQAPVPTPTQPTGSQWFWQKSLWIPEDLPSQ